MQIKTCPKGHRYDPSIYGDECPLCAQAPQQYSEPRRKAPQPAPQPAPDDEPHTRLAQAPAQADEPHTRLAQAPAAADQRTQVAHPAAPRTAPSPAPRPAQQAPQPAPAPAPAGPEGDTRVRPKKPVTAPPAPAHTVIRHPGGSPSVPGKGRKLVGFLVTYNRTPMGRAYNIYEGRNLVGRDRKCDICVPDDSMMSGVHLSILYREADDKFKFRDEQSSNGTYLNRVITDEGELSNYDIIRAGGTIFIFIAIPAI